MPSSIIGPIIGSAASGGISALFGATGKGGGNALSSFTPTGIDAGGLSSTFNNGNIGINVSKERKANVAGVSDTFGQQADALATLLPRVAPGISDLRTARLGALENSRQQAIGNLRDNLARRRVLGSSFAQDAMTRANAEYSQQAQQAEAESFLQEMEMTTQLMQQEFTARRGQFQTNLDEMNLEANLAAGLAGKATDVLSANARISAQLDALSQQGFGKFIGGIAQPIGNAISKGFGGFGGGSAGDPMA